MKKTEKAPTQGSKPRHPRLTKAERVRKWTIALLEETPTNRKVVSMKVSEICRILMQVGIGFTVRGDFLMNSLRVQGCPVFVDEFGYIWLRVGRIELRHLSVRRRRRKAKK